MTTEERFATVQKKIAQHEHRTLLQENRNKEAKTKNELRRKILIGEMFIKHFPIALQFTPGKSSSEDNQIFKPLDDYMGILAECQKSFQKLEDTLIQRQ